MGYTTIFKALALGGMAMFSEQVPASISKNSELYFHARDGFTKAIMAIDDALVGN